MVSEKINLLELSSSLGFGGTERAVINNCKYIHREFFNVYVCGLYAGGYREEHLKDLNVEYVIAKGSIERVLDFIKEKKINAVNFHRSGGVDHLEDSLIKKIKELYPKIVILENNIFGKYDSIAYPYIDGSIFQSMMHIHERYIKKSKKQFDFNRLKVFYNMVDREGFEHYRLNESEIKIFKKSLGILETDFVIGKIARSHVAKWSDLILDMMPYAIKLIPNLKFIIIGVPGSRLGRIRKSSYKNNIIVLNETTDEKIIHRFYQTIDVLTHSSKIGECNGNTINEAMFWSKPVIVNSTPTMDNGQLEQVDHMVTGIIANTPQTYARAVEYMYKNPELRKEMGNNCVKKAYTEYDPRRIVGMLEKFIIEKMKVKGIQVGPEATIYYQDIVYSPDVIKILEYRGEYVKRIQLDFGKLDAKEKIVNALAVPRKVIYRFADSLEGRYGFRI